MAYDNDFTGGQLRNARNGSAADADALKRPVSIRDIAKACGVSVATVSKALNGYKDVSEETAHKIRRMAEKLDYHPDPSAIQLRTNISHNIGVVFEDETSSGLLHPYFSSILNSAKNELERLGYDITFISQKMVGDSFLRHVRYRKCDGILIANVNFKDLKIQQLVQSDIPFITIDYQVMNHSCVMSDNEEGGYELTRYLIENGHRRIAFIHGEDTLVTQKRLQGFRRALSEAGIGTDEYSEYDGKYNNPAYNSEVLRTIMSGSVKPTAIMFSDDFSYIGGRRVLRELGYSIPGDISAVGYDGIDVGQILEPSLTTYRQDAEGIGRLSAQKLIEIVVNWRSSAVEEIKVNGRMLIGETVRDIRGGGKVPDRH
ncbi:MAG: LacI family transcriptional regulator [Eubacterium sp.]|nr:LacI family transcriptional regulator [Eubacterium sp.]